MAKLKIHLSERKLKGIPDKHMNGMKSRKLFEASQEFRIVRCFTGYGYKSTVILNVRQGEYPDMSLCKTELNKSKYSLNNLERE